MAECFTKILSEAHLLQYIIVLMVLVLWEHFISCIMYCMDHFNFY
jgi:hypothetical protein